MWLGQYRDLTRKIPEKRELVEYMIIIITLIVFIIMCYVAFGIPPLKVSIFSFEVISITLLCIYLIKLLIWTDSTLEYLHDLRTLRMKVILYVIDDINGVTTTFKNLHLHKRSIQNRGK